MKSLCRFFVMRSVAFYLFLKIGPSRARTHEIAIMMKDNPAFQCDISHGCPVIVPAIASPSEISSAIELVQLVEDPIWQTALDLFADESIHSLMPSNSDSVVDVSQFDDTLLKNVAIATILDETHISDDATSAYLTNSMFFYWAPALLLLLALGLLLKFLQIELLNVNQINLKDQTCESPTDYLNVIPDGKDTVLCEIVGASKAYLLSIETQLDALNKINVSLEERLQEKHCRLETITADLNAVTLDRTCAYEKVLMQNEEIQQLRNELLVLPSIVQDSACQTENVPWGAWDTAYKAPGLPLKSPKESELTTESTSQREDSMNTSRESDVSSPTVSNVSSPASSRIRKLSIITAESVVINPVCRSLFSPLSFTDCEERDRGDLDYLSAMSSIKKKLAEELGSVNSRTLSASRSPCPERSGSFYSMSEVPPSVLETVSIYNSESAVSDTASNGSQRDMASMTLSWEKEEEEGDVRALTAQCSQSAADPQYATVGEDLFDDEGDLDDEEGFAFRPLTLYSMSTLSSRESPNTTVCTPDSQCNPEEEVARLTETLNVKIQELLKQSRSPAQSLLLDSAALKVSLLNKQLQSYSESKAGGATSLMPYAAMPSKIPRRSVRSMSNPPSVVIGRGEFARPVEME